jgi:UDP-N-acetylglucosamine 2-epimerase
MLTVLSVIGTRPEAIKMAPVVRELARHPQRVRSLVCVTGQHREMLAPILTLFGIVPDDDLDAMQPNQDLAGLTARLLERLDPVIRERAPDWILAQGDTTTVLAAALAAYYRQIPFGHVEAGLRTGLRYQPFPEEMNRRLADVLAERLYAPTARARQALLTEGIAADRIELVGNTVVDALLTTLALPYHWQAGPLADLDPQRRRVLVTAHRRESFGKPFRQLCRAIRELAIATEPLGVEVVYPVHLNPNVLQPVGDILSGLSNVKLLEPLDYQSLVQLMKHSELILTDSGGIQEEAPTLQVPLLVMRDTTERPEGIDLGVAQLVGTDPARIVAEAERILTDPAAHAAMTGPLNPYGDGKAAGRIVASLIDGTAE